MNDLKPPSLWHMNAPSGSFSSPSAPRSASSDVTDAGMFTATQCQNPDGVGASGSKHVTTKLFVPSGNPDQLNCGDVLPPANTCAWSSASPSRTSADVTLNEATAGSSE